jgi:hypothetical protein
VGRIEWLPSTVACHAPYFKRLAKTTGSFRWKGEFALRCLLGVSADGGQGAAPA